MNAMTRVESLLSYSKGAGYYLRRAGRSLIPVGPHSRRGLHDLGPLTLLGLRPVRQHPRMSALIGAGTVAAAGTVYAIRHVGRPFADVLDDEQPYRVSLLEDLRDDEEALALIQRELLAEWGPFGPKDMDEMRRMVKNAGRFVFVIRFYEDGELGPPSGVLQTGLCDAAGDPERLRSTFESFAAITAGGTWEASPHMRGDTAVLLQITAFGDRSRGVGGRLRDTALYMLPDSVRYALTTTPVASGFDMSEPEAQPATKFHYRGGARPSGFAPGFKIPPPDRSDGPTGRQANTDVAFMRYTRLEDGTWDGVKRPPMQVRRHVLELPVPEGVLNWRSRLRRQQAAQQLAA